MKYDIDIFHYIDLYKKQLPLMIFFVILGMFIAGFSGRIQPETYKSTVVALSLKESGQMSSIANFFGLPKTNVVEDVVFSMLKSRRMSDDINRYFNLNNRPHLWWSLDTYAVTGGFAIEVKGPDPDLTEKIANFAVEDLDKINLELQITSNKSLIKVLDPAIKGVPINRNLSTRVMATGLTIFLIYTIFIFFKEYFSHLKAARKKI